jgi:hypothetical protein
MAGQNQPQQPQEPQTNPDGDDQATEDFSDNENSLGAAPNTRPENQTDGGEQDGR